MENDGTLQKELSSFKSRFDEFFNAWLDERIEYIRGKSDSMYSVLRETKPLFVSEGKRIRAYLAHASFLEAGGTEQDAAFQLGIGIELVHAFALVHDDIMDESATRRGHATFHEVQKKYHELHHLRGNSKHFGLSSAILIGDLLLTYANEAMATLPLPHDRVVRTMHMFSRMEQELAAGQYEDISATAALTSITEAQVLHIMSAKTGSYTVSFPLKIGAIAGGWSEKQSSLYDAISIPLGQAFQIHDDILGVFGDEQMTGKSIKSDIAQGKPTLLLVYALRYADQKDADRLLNCVGNESASEEDVAYVRSVFIKTKAKEYAEQQEQKLIASTLAKIQNAKISENLKKQLGWLLAYLIQRKS